VATLDSALNKGLVTLDQLVDLSPRTSRLLPLVDPAAQSGLETLVRLSLRSRRVRVRSQVFIAGVGWVDLIVGDRLVLELDGWEFHGTRQAFEEDRRRDLALVRLGFEVTRLTYAQVTADWPAVEAIILDKVRRQEHLWSARHRRAGMI
jgi:very-short-patch-repair endonuclease